VAKSEFSECSLSDCLDEALSVYPLEKNEREKIKIEKNGDVVFLANKRLVVHVLFNLIKNGLFAIQQAQKGSIFISIDGQTNQLRFKDTANGIKPKLAKKLFKEFYTTKANGTGMGLYFCKQTLTQLGGKISCTTQENLFTEFVLDFPEYRRENNNDDSFAYQVPNNHSYVR
jgi:signal transduction histidine kinase